MMEGAAGFCWTLPFCRWWPSTARVPAGGIWTLAYAFDHFCWGTSRQSQSCKIVACREGKSQRHTYKYHSVVACNAQQPDELHMSICRCEIHTGIVAACPGPPFWPSVLVKSHMPHILYSTVIKYSYIWVLWRIASAMPSHKIVQWHTYNID